ncbi:MAG: hypothetical protein ACON4H_03925, partial [Rubripirellula sp.]
ASVHVPDGHAHRPVIMRIVAVAAVAGVAAAVVVVAAAVVGAVVSGSLNLTPRVAMQFSF